MILSLRSLFEQSVANAAQVAPVAASAGIVVHGVGLNSAAIASASVSTAAVAHGVAAAGSTSASRATQTSTAAHGVAGVAESSAQVAVSNASAARGVSISAAVSTLAGVSTSMGVHGVTGAAVSSGPRGTFAASAGIGTGGTGASTAPTPLGWPLSFGLGFTGAASGGYSAPMVGGWAHGEGPRAVNASEGVHFPAGECECMTESVSMSAAGEVGRPRAPPVVQADVRARAAAQRRRRRLTG